MKVHRFLSWLILFCLLAGPFTGPVQARPPEVDGSEGATTTAPPAGYTPRSITRQILSPQAADVLLIQTALPWDSDADIQVLNSLGYTYDIVDMSNIGTVDIFSYPVVLIVNDQVQAFYDQYAAQVSAFESYVSTGGTLVFFAAGAGWAGGQLNAPLPGGVTWVYGYDPTNHIVDASHPIVTGVLSGGNPEWGGPLTNADLVGNYCSHGYLDNLPSGTNIILASDAFNMPTLMEYGLGSGKVIASTLTWEAYWAWYPGYGGAFAKKALDDVFLYAFSGGIVPVDDLKMSLQIEDAPPGVVVNQVAGDSDGPSTQTTVDIVAVLTSYDPDITNNIAITLTVPGAVLGSPTTSIRTNYLDDDRISYPFETVGPGQYKVTVNLSPLGFGYAKQVIWRFVVPDSPQVVQLNADVSAPNVEIVQSHATAQLNLIDHATTLIVANRDLLYRDYDDNEATSLLRQMFVVAQGPPRNQSPLPVVYYVDRYSSLARNWNNANVNYGSEAQANTVANAIDSLIEDWYEDSREWIMIPLPGGGSWLLPYFSPDYLLIVGDDNTFPFYRYNDPTNDEGITRYDCDNDWLHWKEHPGWCTDSTLNPAIRATDEDYYFTDNPYADDEGGTDWQLGSLEMAVGRVTGDTAENMQNFLFNGALAGIHRTGGVVMASVDGWELGLEPHSGFGAADLYNVPQLFTNRGFTVRNDDNPTTEVRTIDVMEPYEGSDDAWNTNFRNAANDTSGMDIFFIGGHDDYGSASLPGIDFWPFLTPGGPNTHYDRFDDDHPVALIVGCHGGLTVPDLDVPGGADEDMVFDLAQEGASAYIGATGFSYGSPGNLHDATFGENLLQRFFHNLLEMDGTRSRSIGEAMRLARLEYTGTGNHDRKTLTEYIVYGIPWQTIDYPNPGSIEAQSNLINSEPAYIVERAPVIEVVQGTYSQNFTVDVLNYSVMQQEGYDVLSVPGGNLVYLEGYPLLPIVEGYTLTLPAGSSVTNVQLIDSTSSFVGTYNVPIIAADPWTQGGTVFTNTTDVNYPYPSQLVSYEETAEGLIFQVAPLQHNPATKETIFYNHLEVQVTYDVPVDIAVASFALSAQTYKPGEVVVASANIANVGSADATLTAQLQIVDKLGQVLGTQTSGPFSVPAGSQVIQALDWYGSLPEGSYVAQYTVSDSVSILGAASSSFIILGGNITAFNAVSEAEYVNLQVTFENNRSSGVTVAENISIYDMAGVEIARLPQKSIYVNPTSSTTTDFYFETSSLDEGTYTALVIARVDDIQYGPIATSFDVGAQVWAGQLFLPVILRNHGQPIAPEPVLQLYSYELNDDIYGDSYGNGDGIPNPGEFVEINITLQNVGSGAAYTVTLEAISSDPYLNPISAYYYDMDLYFGDIAAGSQDSSSDLDLLINSNTPSGYSIPLSLFVTDGYGHSWTFPLALNITGSDTTPPVADFAETDIKYTPLGSTVYIGTFVREGSDLQQVTAVIQAPSGNPVSYVPMYDDGLHNDYSAGDRYYGGVWSPNIQADFYVGIYALDAFGNASTSGELTYFTSLPFTKTSNILLVMDRQYSYDFLGYYTDALAANGYSYDLWDSLFRGAIDSATLNQYLGGVVIYAMPYYGYLNDNATQSALMTYLDSGGRLFISGQDVGFYLGNSSTFYSAYLHALYVQDDINLFSLNGVLGDPIGNGLSLSISGGDGANNQSWPEEIDPLYPAVPVFVYNPSGLLGEAETDLHLDDERQLDLRASSQSIQSAISSGTGALRVDTGTYKVVYFSFGFEAINNLAGSSRAQVLKAVLDWLILP